jgi:phosphoglycolate phosphatase-like HAD superfamily hydrolase
MPGARVKALILDFDSTISCATFLPRAQQWCVADNVALFESMSDDERVHNFGGLARIAALDALLAALEAASVQLYIISIGYKTALVPHLRTVNLAHYFADERTFGQDSIELRECSFVKAMLIRQIMRKQGWTAEDVLFVDDSTEHIDRASAVCRTLLVSAESKAYIGGMDPAVEMAEIRRVALG